MQARISKKFALIQIKRTDGCAGDASVDFQTVSGTAVGLTSNQLSNVEFIKQHEAVQVTDEEARHELWRQCTGKQDLQDDSFYFLHSKGTVHFKDGCTEQQVCVPLYVKQIFDQTCEFNILLSNPLPKPLPGRQLNSGLYLPEATASCVVYLVSDNQFDSTVKEVAGRLIDSFFSENHEHATIREQLAMVR